MTRAHIILSKTHLILAFLFVQLFDISIPNHRPIQKDIAESNNFIKNMIDKVLLEIRLCFRFHSRLLRVILL